MLAEIITIGDEILIGQVIDTNSAWLGTQLNLLGISVQQITSIGDRGGEIRRALNEACHRAGLVILTGGLGPTRDDITKQTLCEYFATELIFSQEAFGDIERFFSQRRIPVTEVNRRQAYLPASALHLPNPEGTARGMWFTREGIHVISLPGVPFEMQAIMQQSVLPRLAGMNPEKAIVHKTIMTVGIGESFLARKIESWELSLPDHCRLAYLPSPGIVRLRLTARGENRDHLQAGIDEKVAQLAAIIPDYIYGYDDEPLASAVGRLLQQKKSTLGTAESCTGGYIAHLMTSIPGSSAYFNGSVVSYANAVKEKLLGVSPETLETHGAVSRETVEQMAVNARHLLDCGYALAVSGIAGPDGGTPAKPVGLVWIALAGEGFVLTREFHFGGERQRNIQRASLAALNLLRLCLEGRNIPE